MDKKTVFSTLIALVISLVIVFVGSNPSSAYAKVLGINSIKNGPRQLYRVYLSGKSLGVIESKQELEDFIDSKQEAIKKEYDVSKVYIPNGLDIIEEITFNEEVSTISAIYNKIKKEKKDEAFTIDGYKITIQGIEKTSEDGTKETTNNITLYVLDKSIFTNSVERTIKSFINSEEYENFLNDSQEAIKETGTIVEDLYIKNNITIKKGRIPTEARIFQTEEELSKLLLFGTTEDQSKYVVKEGDTIEEIAFENKLSTEEFLIANTEYKTAEDLLYPGKEVVLGVIQPQFDTIEETHVVSKKIVAAQTTYENDDTQYVGYEKVKQDGEDGVSLVTEKIQLTNGEITSVVQIQAETKIVTPAVNKIIVRGTKKYSSGGGGGTWSGDIPVGIGSWVWPTEVPYTISSSYGYRWGKFHEGIDIGSSGLGSPIKAANNGVVIQSGYTKTNGNYIVIAHANGYYTMYAHMNNRLKQVEDVVLANEQIGTMGRSGFATGVHLHFAIYNGMPYRGGAPINPFNIYR